MLITIIKIIGAIVAVLYLIIIYALIQAAGAASRAEEKAEILMTSTSKEGGN